MIKNVLAHIKLFPAAGFCGGKGFFAPVAALDNDWFFLYNTLNVWGILRDTEDIFRETKTGT